MATNYFNLTIEDISRLHSLLERKNWFNIDEELKDNLIEKFSNTISFLNKEEKQLFFSLCDNFENINTIKYDVILRRIVKKLFMKD